MSAMFWVLFVMVVLTVVAAVVGWIAGGQQAAAINERYKAFADEITPVETQAPADYFTLRPNWEEAPAWAEWAAQDEDGSLWLFEMEPRLPETNADQWISRENDKGKHIFLCAGGCGYNPNWRNAIEQRPVKSADVVANEPLAMPANGWTDNTGECPVPKGTLIDVEYNDGVVSHGVKALVVESSGLGDCEDRLATNWYVRTSPYLIRRWRLHEASITDKPLTFPVTLSVTQAEYERYQAIEAAARTYHKTGSETARNRLGKALGVKP